MKITINTARKIKNLHNDTATGAILTHEKYTKLFGDIERYPSFQTLKAHDLVKIVRIESRLPEDEVFTTTPEWERNTVYYCLNV